MSRRRLLIDDGNQIRLGTGIGKYSLYLYEALLNLGYDVTLVEQGQSTEGSRTKQRIEYLKLINSSEYIKYTEENYDAILYTNYVIPFKRSKKVKYLATVADMVAFLYPDTLPAFYRYYNQVMIRNTVNNADLVFTISKSVKNEIIHKFPKSEENLVYTWLGIYDGIQPLNDYAPYNNEQLIGIDDSPYFLFISTVEKRKNVGMVIDAFLDIKKHLITAERYKLVIVGRPGYGYEEFVEKVNASKYRDDVVFAGYTSDADCNRLYNHASAFVFPTVYEGFGFAQIECMKCHLPIILSDIPTNREISRDYGMFFDLERVSSLIDQMKLIVEGKYNYEAKNYLADKYITDFDWNKIAQQYIDIIDSLVK